MLGCTIVTRNYLAEARVTAASFLERHPGAGFAVLLAGDREPAAPGDHFELLVPHDIGIDAPEWCRRLTAYGPQARVSAMKPELLRALLARGEDAVVLLDADGVVYDALTPAIDVARAHAIALTPHAFGPWEQVPDGDGPEQVILSAGVINSGFVAVGPGAEAFLDWWAARTRRQCVFDLARMLFLGQTWLSLAPQFFGARVLDDPGINLSAWGLHDRDVEWEGDRPTVSGVPLRWFHIGGGFDPHAADVPAEFAGRPGAARVLEYCARLLLAAGWDADRARGPGDELDDGSVLAPWMREAYRLRLVAAERDGVPEPPNPFAAGAADFLAWVQSLSDDRGPTIGRAVRPGDALEAERAARRGAEAAVAELRAARAGAEPGHGT